MFTLSFHVADLFLTAIRNKDGFWYGVSADALTGKEHSFDMMKDEEIAAISFLAISGNDNDDVVTNDMYQIAERAIDGWPKECRPFP